ncbi:sirohydrochlorin cobaltochelatase [Desulfocicer vacuolatum DSM 3385]|uniref:Sirohydrochlorin cobaltochelatase n=1 Tax=Desulfocicer vacuolatum DSM 3385 TaxID=1121400 RepID=A0A1W2ALS6_9BACT|nr:sirohydrochlorin cobaltochelatase [Desulfocicer vacuolatum]SMC61411.1 sirohydrochlorin cobaltochelatase [Desulfocicer vacuolatum DSM 3385]
MKQKLIVLMAVVLTLTFGTMAFAGHCEKKETKKGILLVAFGSSEASAQVSFENIDKKVKATFPAIPVRWAFTSHIIRNKLAKQGKILDAPEVALAKMHAEGFTHVAVQSLHTIGGAEYHDLRKIVGSFKMMGFEKIILGYPLMSTQHDMERIVDAILANIPKERKKNEAVVLMGHGTHHPANAFYGSLMFQLQLRDANVYVGTVEGYPDLDTIQSMLLKKGIKKAYLMPFMSVAGDHAKNDMAGPEEDSWNSILTKAGIKCTPVLKGTAEYDNFVQIWVDHLKGPVGHF